MIRPEGDQQRGDRDDQVERGHGPAQPGAEPACACRSSCVGAWPRLRGACPAGRRCLTAVVSSLIPLPRRSSRVSGLPTPPTGSPRARRPRMRRHGRRSPLNWSNEAPAGASSTVSPGVARPRAAATTSVITRVPSVPPSAFTSTTEVLEHQQSHASQHPRLSQPGRRGHPARVAITPRQPGRDPADQHGADQPRSDSGDRRVDRGTLQQTAGHPDDPRDRPAPTPRRRAGWWPWNRRRR